MRLFLLFITWWVMSAPGHAAATAAPAASFILLDPTAMAAYKTAYKANHQPETAQVKELLAQADKALKKALYTIVTKPQTPPSGDKHDFISQAPYFWPDPTKPDGKPYISKDGLVNPEASAMKDNETVNHLCADVQALALAYYFSGQEAYAAQAAKQLRGFFLDPATRMNPNLNYSQGVPGSSEGRSYGIIQSRYFTNIPDALALLNGSRSMDESLRNGLKSWFNQFADWLTTSKLGREEGHNSNNHGVFYDMQVVDYALFTGNEKLAREIIQRQTLPRVAVHFEPGGAQPLELARTRPWNYTTMNLQGWVRLAIMADKLHIDLWHYTTPDGRGLRPAVDWFRPYLLKQKQMEKADVAATSNTSILESYEQARRAYPDLKAAEIFALYPDFKPVPWAL
jgi:hypothetical protein